MNGVFGAILVLLVILFLLSSLRGDEVTESVDQWMKKNSTKDANVEWEKKTLARLADAETQGESSMESAAVRIVTDFCADKSSGLKNFTLDDKDKLELCRWYWLFHRKEWTLPSRLQEHLTVENVKKTLGKGAGHAVGGEDKND
jgi:hypothetical protein